jgi:hypothetical protein
MKEWLKKLWEEIKPCRHQWELKSSWNDPSGTYIRNVYVCPKCGQCNEDFKWIGQSKL